MRREKKYSQLHFRTSEGKLLAHAAALIVHDTVVITVPGLGPANIGKPTTVILSTMHESMKDA